MPAYVKGTDVDHEIAEIREGVARVGADMQSDPDAAHAFGTASKLERLGAEISEGASASRAWFVAELIDERHMSYAEIGASLGISVRRVGQLAKAGRQRKGNPIVDPGTEKLQLPLVLAIITGPRGVLVAHRIDERPPWTFPGGNLLNMDETPAECAARRVLAETGLVVETRAVFGERVHPRTNIHTVYLSCSPVDDDAEPVLGDRDDLDRLEWIGLDEAKRRMPDMFEPVLASLSQVLTSIGAF